MAAVGVTLTGGKPCELTDVEDEWAEERIIDPGRERFGETVDPCRYTPSLGGVSKD